MHYIDVYTSILHTGARHIAASCLLMRSRRLARVLTRTYLDHMSEVGLTVGQFTLLTAVGCTPGARAADLAPGLDLEKSTLSRELAPMVADGLIEVRALDGRSQGLFLTEAGAARLDAAIPAWEAAQAAVAQDLGALGQELRTRFPAA